MESCIKTEELDWISQDFTSTTETPLNLGEASAVKAES